MGQAWLALIPRIHLHHRQPGTEGPFGEQELPPRPSMNPPYHDCPTGFYPVTTDKVNEPSAANS
jgi:hypothetical protein